MQLYIKQRIFSWTDSYDVYDENGIPRYEVRADFFALGHQIHVYDKQTGLEVGSIHQKLLRFLPEFEIRVNGESLGRIRRTFTLLSPRYEVDYQGWDVTGNFLGWEYRVTRGSSEVMSISKEFFHWSDAYVLRYRNPADELPGLLLVIAIDAANCSHND